MVEKRYMASALTLNETTLWIVGGDGLFNVGTEFVTLGTIHKLRRQDFANFDPNL